jgi:acyl-CoA synthetase (AMP-forming)/AMP-acid ligase II
MASSKEDGLVELTGTELIARSTELAAKYCQGPRAGVVLFGFTHEGALYVIGRIRDTIIVGGVKIFREDIEALVNALNDVYPVRGDGLRCGRPDAGYGKHGYSG